MLKITKKNQGFTLSQETTVLEPTSLILFKVKKVLILNPHFSFLSIGTKKTPPFLIHLHFGFESLTFLLIHLTLLRKEERKEKVSNPEDSNRTFWKLIENES